MKAEIYAIAFNMSHVSYAALLMQHIPWDGKGGIVGLRQHKALLKSAVDELIEEGSITFVLNKVIPIRE